MIMMKMMTSAQVIEMSVSTHPDDCTPLSYHGTVMKPREERFDL